jgi:transitional endoplasmic reticulum ATPase
MSKWVGESEKAIRMIFKKAKQVAPSIVFLDEIDAIAPRRGGHFDSGATERVVNQLLTSMDGLDSMSGVFVIAATNRPDILDKALLRPGRFDKLLLTPLPDEEARLKILEVHTREMPLKNVDLKAMATRLEGYVGADIENLCREAAMISLREDREAIIVTSDHFEEAMKLVRASTDNETAKVYESLVQEMTTAMSKRPKDDNSLGYYR